MQQDQLRGKLERLVEELRSHGGNGHSVYARRLRLEISATEAEIKALAIQQYPGHEQGGGDRLGKQDHNKVGGDGHSHRV